MSDHLLDVLAPVPTLAAIAQATTTLRLGSLVLNNDLRHPAVLAQDLASVDRLSGGRGANRRRGATLTAAWPAGCAQPARRCDGREDRVDSRSRGRSPTLWSAWRAGEATPASLRSLPRRTNFSKKMMLVSMKPTFSRRKRVPRGASEAMRACSASGTAAWRRCRPASGVR